MAQSCRFKDILSACTVKLLLPCSLLMRILLASARVCLLASCPSRACFSAFRRSRATVMVPFSACTGALADQCSFSWMSYRHSAENIWSVHPSSRGIEMGE